jgi:hypothetical protein
MRINFTLFVIIAGLGFFAGGCNIINPKEQVPTYIHIDSFKFNPNPLFTNISSSHDINNVWVYYNNNLIGEFDLPATVPIIASGRGNLEVSPGVLENGQNSLVLVYPFYALDTSSFTAQPGKVINYTPKTTYFSNIRTNVLSNFESGIYFVRSAGSQAMTVVTSDSLVFEGHGAGAVYLNAVGDSSVDSSVNTFTIPANSQAYIEFNYKSSVPFYIGLQANLGTVTSSAPYYLIGINPSNQWGKFYLNVSDFATQYKGTSYNLYIKAVLADGQASGRLLIDNIQLIYF